MLCDTEFKVFVEFSNFGKNVKNLAKHAIKLVKNKDNLVKTKFFSSWGTNLNIKSSLFFYINAYHCSLL